MNGAPTAVSQSDIQSQVGRRVRLKGPHHIMCDEGEEEEEEALALSECLHILRLNCGAGNLGKKSQMRVIR